MNQVLEEFRTDLSTHSNCFIRSSETTNRNYVPRSGLRIQVAKRLTGTTFRQLRRVNKNEASRLACLDNRLSDFVQAKLPVKVHQMSSSVISRPTAGRNYFPVNRYATSNKLIPFWGANFNSIAPAAGFAIKSEAGRRCDRVTGQALLQVLLRKTRLHLTQSNYVEPITNVGKDRTGDAVPSGVLSSAEQELCGTNLRLVTGTEFRLPLYGRAELLLSGAEQALRAKARRGLRPSGPSKSSVRPPSQAEPRRRPGPLACSTSGSRDQLSIRTTFRFAENEGGLSKNLSKRSAHVQNQRFFAETDRVGDRFRLVAPRLQYLVCYATKSRFGLHSKPNGHRPVRLTWNFAMDTIYCRMSCADEGVLGSRGQSISSTQYLQKIVSKAKYKTIRPLLNLSRQTLTTLCKDLCLPVYPDKSNKAVQFSRNRLREQILPAVKMFLNPKIEDALFKLAEFLIQDFSVVSHLVNTGRRLKL